MSDGVIGNDRGRDLAAHNLRVAESAVRLARQRVDEANESLAACEAWLEAKRAAVHRLGGNA